MNTTGLLTFEQALDLILKEAPKLSSSLVEKVAISEATGRILAETVSSAMNVPSFDNSAMDGYAIRFSDFNESTLIPVADKVFAGSTQEVNWPQGSCIRIMTGAPIPKGTDAVVMQENTTQVDGKIQFHPENIKPNDNIRRIGENIAIGDQLASKGDKLTIPLLSTLATLGISELQVFKPIKVALFSTGDELTPLGEPLTQPNAIYDSNRLTLKLLLKKMGCEVIDFGIIKDDLAQITATLKQASEAADLVITSGGVSVGDADYTKQALESLGTVNFWKIAMKPGKPFAFGYVGKALFCGLPGNPVSTLVTFYQLVKPLIEAGYYKSYQLNAFLVKSESKIKKKAGRMDFQRGTLYRNASGELVVKTTGGQDSHLTTSFHEANCFIRLEKDRGTVEIGENVVVEPFDELLH